MHSCGHLFHKLIPLIWIRTLYQIFKLTEEHDSCICWIFVCKTYLLFQNFMTKISPFLEKYYTKNISKGNPYIILQESATCAYLFRRRHDITCCLPGSVGLPTQGTLLWVIVALGRKVISFFSSGEHFFSRKFSFQTQLVGVPHHCYSRHHWCIWRGRIIASQ